MIDNGVENDTYILNMSTLKQGYQYVNPNGPDQQSDYKG
jgi:hypothetical protein